MPEAAAARARIPGMSVAQRSIVILVAALVIGAVVVVVALSLGRDGTATGSGDPTRSASASSTATEAATDTPTASPDASAPTDDETLAILTEIEEQIEAIRGLEPADIGAPDLITRDELRVELEQIFDEEYPQEERDRDNLALRAFGLLEPDQDVAELQLSLLGDGVLGFYDDTDRRMVVVTDAGLDAIAKLTYAHEYTHALQDAAFGLDSLETDAVGEDDRGLARTALIEGDANTTMLAWAFGGHLTQAEILSLQDMPLPDTSGIPSWMVAQLDFPYTIGQAWVLDLAGGNMQAPDFTEVNAAYLEPPSSTEQVIDVDAYRAREEPIPVELPDLAAALGAGWEEVDTSPVGEATIGIILEFFGVPFDDAGLAADGWGGDRATVVTGPGGDFALAWRLAWDAPADAGEFVAAYEIALGALDFPASVRQLPGGDVLVVHASTEAIHDATVGAAGG